MPRYMLAFVFSLALSATSRADGPKDNLSDNVRPIPPLGIEVPAADRQELEQGLARLQTAIDALRKRRDALTPALLPDVIVFHRAVDVALRYNEFHAPGDIKKAKEQIKLGQERAENLLAGRAPWTTQTGLVVRGYESKIDGSVQPYGLVVPTSYQAAGPFRHRLDVWLHGRGETVSEVNFIDQRLKQPGQFTPADTFVLHPYGRYCNAFKFAGEVDVYEALASTQQRYSIDEDRIAIRGFSMGGAGVWHLAVHNPSRWFAANPGAGFSETPEFLNVFQQEVVAPTWYEKTLWQLYDCPGWAGNLRQCPTVAYSGEIDKQKQAADVMAAALEREGLSLLHVIGPQTAHKYHPDAAAEVERRLKSLARWGRGDHASTVDFTTYSLRYNSAACVTVDGLGEHWKPARVRLAWPRPDRVEVSATNVEELTLAVAAGRYPAGLPASTSLVVAVGSDELKAPGPKSDLSWFCQLHKADGHWRVGPRPDDGALRKRHGLQGPIDDAFMDAFIFVRPTGKARHAEVEKWTRAEFEHATRHWRQHFRGDARVKNDTELTDDDLAGANIVLFGDPASNAVLKRIADKLPLQWTDGEVVVGSARFPARTHAPVLIYPNPLNPRRYVVLNSGFTFREYDYLNNARQVPKLPDWAVIDLSVAPNSRWPGKVVAADFFDEQWKLKPAAR